MVIKFMLTNSDLSPEEMINALQLTKLKDKLWYVAPSVATEGTGIFEGLVSIVCRYNNFFGINLCRPGSPTTSKPPLRNRHLSEDPLLFLFFGFTFVLMTRRSIWTFVSFLSSRHFLFSSPLLLSLMISRLL